MTFHLRTIYRAVQARNGSRVRCDSLTEGGAQGFKTHPPGVSGARLSPAPTRPLRRPAAKVSHLTRINSASRRTKQALPAFRDLLRRTNLNPLTATITYTEGRTPPAGPVALSLAEGDRRRGVRQILPDGKSAAQAGTDGDRAEAADA